MADDKTESCTFGGFVMSDGTMVIRDIAHFDEPSGRCHDCNIKHGGYHHHGCDVERCPICGQQLISCEHEVYSLIAITNMPKLGE